MVGACDHAVAPAPTRSTVASIDPVVPYLYPGASRQLTLTLHDAAGNVIAPKGSVFWSSSDSTVVSVDQRGVITGIAGSQNVTVSAAVDGATATVTVPLNTISTIELGEFHGCFLNSSGQAFCWGRNLNGELGNGSATPDTSLVPVHIVSSERFTKLSAGGSHTCGVSVQQLVLCWGLNASGEIGDGSTTNRPFPETIGAGLRFTEIAAGNSHTCGITIDNLIYCWGMGSSPPQRVDTQLRLVNVTAGNGVTCGLDAAGVAYCWGVNGSGELGNGTGVSSANPTPVAGGHRFRMIDAGGSVVCGITTEGEAWCWGKFRNDLAARPIPEKTSGTLNLTTLSVSDSHECVLTTDGTARCMGIPGDGELGMGETFPHVPMVTGFVPVVTTPGIPPWQSVSVGWGSSCGVTRAGTPYCWGYWARIGAGTDRVQYSPVMQAVPMFSRSTSQ